MIIEATETLQVEAKLVVRYLKERPTEVQKLAQHLVVPEKIQAIGVRTLAPTLDDLLASREFKMAFGFLTNDAINLAVMPRTRSRETRASLIQAGSSRPTTLPSPPPRSTSGLACWSARETKLIFGRSPACG